MGLPERADAAMRASLSAGLFLTASELL